MESRRTKVVEDGGCQCLTEADTRRKDHVRASTPRLTDSHQTLWHRPQVRFYELRREVRPAPAGHATRADGDETKFGRPRAHPGQDLPSRAPHAELVALGLERAIVQGALSRNVLYGASHSFARYEFMWAHLARTLTEWRVYPKCMRVNNIA